MLPLLTVPRTIATERVLQSLGPLPRSQVGPALYLTIGLPGSGKSTFARRLAGSLGAIVLESDALRQALFGAPVHSPAENRTLFSAIHAAAGRLLDEGRVVIIDATSLRERDRRPVHALAARRGLPLQVLYFRAPPAIIEERLRRRSLDDAFAADVSVYRRMAPQLQPPSGANLIIDTSSDAAVAEVLQRLVNAAATAEAHNTQMMGALS